jgi:hypothetical protein
MLAVGSNAVALGLTLHTHVDLGTIAFGSTLDEIFLDQAPDTGTHPVGDTAEP